MRVLLALALLLLTAFASPTSAGAARVEAESGHVEICSDGSEWARVVRGLVFLPRFGCAIRFIGGPPTLVIDSVTFFITGEEGTTCGHFEVVTAVPSNTATNLVKDVCGPSGTWLTQSIPEVRANDYRLMWTPRQNGNLNANVDFLTGI